MNNNFDLLDKKGNNIIHKLVKSNNSKILKETLESLIEKGDLQKLINQKNYYGYTPLHIAINKENQSFAQILINNGADIRILTDNGYSIKWIEEKQKKIDSLKIIGIRFL
jgi:ankyrin repeat protein